MINDKDLGQIKFNILVHEALADHKQGHLAVIHSNPKGRLNSDFHVKIQYNCQLRHGHVS